MVGDSINTRHGDATFCGLSANGKHALVRFKRRVYYDGHWSFSHWYPRYLVLPPDVVTQLGDVAR